MFRGDLKHTGVYHAAGVPNFNGIKWKFHTGGRVIASPAVVNGVVYVGSTDGNFYAIDAASGAEKWKFTSKAWEVSSPAVASGVVYFLSYDGNFYALDAASGQVKWKFNTGGERHYSGTHLHYLQPVTESMPDPWDFYLSSPAVWNGAVYFGSSDGNVYALDVDSGALKWKFKTGDIVHSSPAIVDGTVYVGSWDTYLYAIDAANGNEKWRFKTGDDPVAHNHVGIQSSPALSMAWSISDRAMPTRMPSMPSPESKCGSSPPRDHGSTTRWCCMTERLISGRLFPGLCTPSMPRQGRVCLICRPAVRCLLRWRWPGTRSISGTLAGG